MAPTIPAEEEACPLLATPQEAHVLPTGAPEIPEATKPAAVADPKVNPPYPPPVWTVDGLPFAHGSVIGEPVARSSWDSGLFSCLGRNDEFCSSDLEVCLLGSFAPCILHGTNAERIRSGPGTFANHCLAYSGLCLLGNSFLGYNGLAPWLSFSNRTAVRRKFNLEGNFEACSRSCGCCGSIIDDEEQLERCETMCDFTTHFFCHTCALCQEGRELRRRLPHPGFNGRSVLVMIPPVEQTMARGA